MDKRVGFLKTTAVGGLVFLVPFIIVVLIFGKALDLVRTLVLWLEAEIPAITVGGVLALNGIAVTVLFGLCFLSGLIAQSGFGTRLRQRIDGALTAVMPGYSFIKGVTEGLRISEEQSRSFVPCVVHYDDNSQLAFEVERTPKGRVVIYLPGCPDPWSGSVIYMTEDRVEPIEMTVNEALKNIRTLGRGSSKYSDKIG